MSGTTTMRDINVYNLEGKTPIFINTAIRGKAFHLSGVVRAQLKAGGVSQGGTFDEEGVIFPSEEVDRFSAQAFINFVNSYKAATNKGIQPTHIKSNAFEKVVRVYKAFKYLKVDPFIRGDDIRDAICRAPPTLRKVTLLNELAWFDGGLTFDTIRQYAALKVSFSPYKIDNEFEKYVAFMKLDRTMKRMEREEFKNMVAARNNANGIV